MNVTHVEVAQLSLVKSKDDLAEDGECNGDLGELGWYQDLKKTNVFKVS